MRLQRKALLVVIVSMAILAIALGVAIYLVTQGEINFRDQGFLESRSQEFLSEPSLRRTEGEGYKLVAAEISVQDPSWALLTVARTNSGLDEESGSEGLIAVGHLQINGWKFRLIGEPGFGGWLDRLPKDLLSDTQKVGFQAVVEEQPQTSLNPTRPHQELAFQTETVYNLPYEEDEKYPITTLPGEGYHQGAIKHAIDFGLPKFTKIAAITGGTVLEVKNDSTASGCNPRYVNDANFIRIRTTDSNGTILYLHLAPFTAQVGRNDKVEAGQIIGRSGATGFTCNFAGTGPGPHLHVVRERWCGNRICGSLPLRFAEFKQNDPRRGELYESDNFSPQERERIKRVGEAERQRKEVEQVEEAVASFHTLFRCSTIKDCNQNQVISGWVTQGLFQQLFPTICFGCPEKWDESQQIENQLQPFSPPKVGRLEVKAKEVWETMLGEERFTHYTYVTHFLVKETDDWKVDGWEIECGYVTDRVGNIVKSKNLEGCPWQPPNGTTSPTAVPNQGED